MAGERDVRAGRADTGIEIVDVSGARFAEGDAVDIKSRTFEQRLKYVQRADVRRRRRRATDRSRAMESASDDLIAAMLSGSEPKRFGPCVPRRQPSSTMTQRSLRDSRCQG